MGATISTTQWFVYGKKHFTKTGYEKHIKKYQLPVQNTPYIRPGQEGEDGVNLEGKVIVVTGANSGIGKEVATYCAAKGSNLYMLCRSKDRAEAARAEIAEKTSNDKIKIILGDLGELSQVRKVAQELQSMETKVDCVVCNAGVLLNDRKETSEGNEVTFASHFLGGSYLLTQLLMPLLKASSDSRVVFVSSGGMLLSKFPDWKTATNVEKETYDGTNMYTYAKRGQVLLAERWSKEYPDTTFVSCHPGWTATAAVDDAFGDQKKYLEPMRDTWQGAEGICWLASTDKSNLESGAFYLDRKPQKKNIAGPFMTAGSYTKNSEEEVDTMMKNLKEAAGL